MAFRVPKRLTSDEWNLLVWLVTFNHMDSWCDFREGSKEDYVYDTDEKKRISLRSAIRDISEGLYEPDLRLYAKGDGEAIWRDILLKFKINND